MKRAERTVRVDAPPEACWAVLADFERWPDWQPAVERVEVVERDERSALVAFEADAKVRRLRYRARYLLDPPGRMEWTLVDGDVRGGGGEFVLAPLDGGSRTEATYRLSVELGFPLPGPLLRRGTQVLMGGVTEGLKRRAER